MPKIFIFDLETSGLPQTKRFNVFYDYQQIHQYDSARIVQIAGWLIDENYTKLIKHNYIIKPVGFIINNTHIHKIEHEDALKYGSDFKQVIQEMLPTLAATDVFLTHNINFDKNVLLSELYRHQMYDVIQMLSQKKFICSMEHTKDILCLPLNNITYKYPKLSELYYWCFGRNPEILHSAIADVESLYEIIACGNLPSLMKACV